MATEEEQETPRERFLRNHQERVRTMRAIAIAAEREGNTQDAAIVRSIADAWDGIARKAELQP